MLLTQWAHDKVDLDDALDVERPGFSVLANAVEFLNSRLLEALNREAGFGRPSRVLEVGCGSYSLVKVKLAPLSTWEGIDVNSTDRKGNPTVATRIASVGDIPWPKHAFDVVIANQSVEHWHEYGVRISSGLQEIGRVLRPGGRAYINFPIHLHGHRMFVRGDFAAIEQAFQEAGLHVLQRVAVEKRSEGPYAGWRLCGFPDFVVRESPSSEETSYIVEYVAEPASGAPPAAAHRRGTLKALGPIRRHLHYGARYALWKVGSRLLGRQTRR